MWMVLSPLFPPQSQHEMFLMRKNHLDFKNLAQALTLDQHRREEYVQVGFLTSQ